MILTASLAMVYFIGVFITACLSDDQVPTTFALYFFAVTWPLLCLTILLARVYTKVGKLDYE